MAAATVNAAKASLPRQKVEAQQEYFVCPDWVGVPAEGVHLAVWRDGALLETVMLDKSPYYMMGRGGDAADVFVNHPSISRAHCVFVHHRKGSLYVIDLASTHGVFVNDSRIASKKTVKVTENDEVRLGASSRVYKLSRAPPSKRPLAASEEAPDAKRAKTGEVAAGGAAAKRPSGIRTFHILLKTCESSNPKSHREPGKKVTRTPAEAVAQLKQVRTKIDAVCLH